MNKRTRAILGALGTWMLLFGIGCINYTKMGNFERHSQFAREHHLPPPSRGIVYLGMLFTPIGAGMIGFVLSRKKAVP